MQFTDLLTLEPHGPDTWIGTGPRYPWGGLYGGQIVAQSQHDVRTARLVERLAQRIGGDVAVRDVDRAHGH